MEQKTIISNKGLFDFICRIASREELTKPNLVQDIENYSSCLHGNDKEFNEDKYDIIEGVLCLISKHIKNNSK